MNQKPLKIPFGRLDTIMSNSTTKKESSKEWKNKNKIGLKNMGVKPSRFKKYGKNPRMGFPTKSVNQQNFPMGLNFAHGLIFHGFSKNEIHYFKNDSPKFYRIKLFYLKNHQIFYKNYIKSL
jgi:hypothetical protein